MRYFFQKSCKVVYSMRRRNIFMECTIRSWDIKDAEEFITSMLGADADKTFAFAICVGEEAVGSIGVFRCDNIHRQTAEMGYYIAEKYWGKGIATSAVKQACAYVFSNTDIIRIFAEPFAYNAGSCRVLEKAGFELDTEALGVGACAREIAAALKH